MIEEDRYCLDILAQLHAARAALRAVEDAVLGDHITHCVEDAIASGDPRSQREKLEELLEILIRRPECSMAE